MMPQFNQAMLQKGDLEQTPSLKLQPEAIVIKDDGKCFTVTLGDQHGNAMKTLSMLVEQGIIQMDDQIYLQLKDIWKYFVDQINWQKHRPLDLDKQYIPNMAKFEYLLANKVTPGINSEKFQVRFLGDLIGDRGCNDYLMLQVLNILNKFNVPYEITAADHDMLIVYFADQIWNKGMITGSQLAPIFTNWIDEVVAEKKCLSTKDQILNELKQVWVPTYLMSGINKATLNNPELENQIKSMVKSVVVSNLKLISYELSQNEQKVTMFTHGVNNELVVRQLAQELKVLYSDSTPKEFCETIDRLNSAFSSRLMQQDPEMLELIIKGFVQGFCYSGDDAYSDKLKDCKSYSGFGRLIWSKDWSGCDKSTQLDYVSFVAGHSRLNAEIQNKLANRTKFTGLDDMFGRIWNQPIMENERDSYKIYYSKELKFKPNLTPEIEQKLEINSHKSQ